MCLCKCYCNEYIGPLERPGGGGSEPNNNKLLDLLLAILSSIFTVD